MQFKVIQEITGNIINTIQNVGIASVNAIKAHTFGVTVKNFPKNQTVSGTVTVANQKKVEKKLSEGHLIQKSVLSWLRAFKLPSSIEVSNFPERAKPAVFPKSFNIDNFPKQLPYPKNFRVSNQPTAQLKTLNVKIDKLTGEIKKLKLDPTIKVEAPKTERVVVPAPSVTVKQEKIDYKKLAALMPKPAKEIDYDKLSKSISKQVAGMVVSVGGGGGKRKEGLDDLTRSYNIADKDAAGDVKYYGFTGRTGDWYILKEDSTTYEYRYIKGSSGYAENWTDRATLEYGYYHIIF